jgi:hypothetical protein
MPRCRITWIIEGKFYGQKEYDSKGNFVPNSLCFFCPRTGEIWARALVEPIIPDGKPIIWAIRNAPSRRSGEPGQLGQFPWWFFPLPDHPPSDELWLYQATLLLEAAESCNA